MAINTVSRLVGFRRRKQRVASFYLTRSKSTAVSKVRRAVAYSVQVCKFVKLVKKRTVLPVHLRRRHTASSGQPMQNSPAMLGLSDVELEALKVFDRTFTAQEIRILRLWAAHDKRTTIEAKDWQAHLSFSAILQRQQQIFA